MSNVEHRYRASICLTKNALVFFVRGFSGNATCFHYYREAAISTSSESYFKSSIKRKFINFPLRSSLTSVRFVP